MSSLLHLSLAVDGNHSLDLLSNLPPSLQSLALNLDLAGANHRCRELAPGIDVRDWKTLYAPALTILYLQLSRGSDGLPWQLVEEGADDFELRVGLSPVLRSRVLEWATPRPALPGQWRSDFV